jgi:hypothetical protein
LDLVTDDCALLIQEEDSKDLKANDTADIILLKDL